MRHYNAPYELLGCLKFRLKEGANCNIAQLTFLIEHLCQELKKKLMKKFEKVERSLSVIKGIARCCTNMAAAGPTLCMTKVIKK